MPTTDLEIELIRPFLPSKNFEVSKSFYEVLGFSMDLAGPGIAFAAYPPQHQRFLLQDFYHKEFAENLMMQMLVTDVDQWWAKIEGLDLTGMFGVRAPKAPKLEPWGMRVCYVWDPAGVLWHIASR